MVSLNLILDNKSGLHARPANLFTTEAAKYKSSVKVLKNGKEYNAKSIFSVLSMGATLGTELTIVVDGEDEELAIKALKDLFDQNFGE
jgi:phosphocarrier protein